MIKPRSSKINWTKVLAAFRAIVIFLVLFLLFKLLTIEPIPENKPLPPIRPEPSPSGSVEYPDVSIFYEHEAQVWRCNARSGEIRKIAWGYYPTLSPDRKELAYVIPGYMKPSKDEKDNKPGLYLYEVDTGDIGLLSHDSYDTLDMDWSPDGRYIMGDRGTGIIREKIVIERATGKPLVTFGVWNESYEWLDGQMIVYDRPQRVSQYRPYDSGKGSSVCTINLDGRVRILKKATSISDYGVIQVLQNGRIGFSEEFVIAQSQWEKGGIPFCQTMNRQGGGLRWALVKKSESAQERVKRLLPPGYQNYHSIYHVSFLAENPNWALCAMNLKGGSLNDYEIYLMNLAEPSQSIKKLADGSRPMW